MAPREPSWIVSCFVPEPFELSNVTSQKPIWWMDDVLENKQEALLSQRGRAMLRVCQ